MAGIGLDTIRDKADILMEKFMVEELADPRSFEWWGKTWSMASGHGRWSICHGQYAGYVTNASMEREWREDKEPCSPKASMGEYLGARCATIKAKGKEHRQRLIDLENLFMSTGNFVHVDWKCRSFRQADAGPTRGGKTPAGPIKNNFFGGGFTPIGGR
jgi:hypothetical protein